MARKAKKKQPAPPKPKGKAGAPLGNKNAEKFTTPAERKEAFKAFCEHIAAGYSQDTFHKPCVFNTIMKMISDYPDEFDQEVLLMAKAEGKFFWESMGKLGAMGKIKGFNQQSWWRNMQNKLGWKDKIEHGGDGDSPIVVIKRYFPLDDEPKAQGARK